MQSEVTVACIVPNIIIITGMCKTDRPDFVESTAKVWKQKGVVLFHPGELLVLEKKIAKMTNNDLSISLTELD